MTTRSRHFHLLPILLLATACWDWPGPDLPDPTIPWPSDDGGDEGGEDHDEDGGEPCDTGEPEPFDCNLIQECLWQLDDACADFDACYSLKPDDVTCGDLTCNGPGELGPCGEICPQQNLCIPTDECIAACDDPCDMDCLWGCWDTSPDCLGTACVIVYGCEECP